MKEFQGTGWGFPIETDADGEIRTVSGPADVEESIRIVLGTSPGERVMRPDFGCGIDEFAFATIDTTTLGLIETTVREALETWERRIEVLDVEADAENLATGRIDVTIEYRLRRTDDEYNLVYPFYVEGAR